MTSKSKTQKTRNTEQKLWVITWTLNYGTSWSNETFMRAPTSARAVARFKRACPNVALLSVRRYRG